MRAARGLVRPHRGNEQGRARRLTRQGTRGSGATPTTMPPARPRRARPGGSSPLRTGRRSARCGSRPPQRAARSSSSVRCVAVMPARRTPRRRTPGSAVRPTTRRPVRASGGSGDVQLDAAWVGADHRLRVSSRPRVHGHPRSATAGCERCMGVLRDWCEMWGGTDRAVCGGVTVGGAPPVAAGRAAVRRRRPPGGGAAVARRASEAVARARRGAARGRARSTSTGATGEAGDGQAAGRTQRRQRRHGEQVPVEVLVGAPRPRRSRRRSGPGASRSRGHAHRGAPAGTAGRTPSRSR